MEEAHRLVAQALRQPPQHPGPVAVDSVPHHLSYEPTDLTETGHPVELGRSQRHLFAANLRDQLAGAGMNEEGLAGSRAQARLRLHPPHQELEVARGKVEIHVELAEVVEAVEVDALQAGVEGFDHARSDAPAPAVGAPDDPEEGK